VASIVSLVTGGPATAQIVIGPMAGQNHHAPATDTWDQFDGAGCGLDVVPRTNPTARAVGE